MGRTLGPMKPAAQLAAARGANTMAQINNPNLGKPAPGLFGSVIQKAYQTGPYVKTTAAPRTQPQYKPVPLPAKKSTSSSSSSSSSRSSGGGSTSSRSSGGGGGGGGGGGFDGGGGGGGFGGGGGGDFSAAPVMQTITIPDPEQDVRYKQSVDDLAVALADFKNQQKLSRTQYDVGWNDAKRRMGWKQNAEDATKGEWDPTGANAFGESYKANENDFAGRGMRTSGAYLQAVADMYKDYNDRLTNLNTSRDDNVATQNQALDTFTRTQESAKKAAMTDAVSRIAASLGIDINQVKPGGGTIQREAV